MSSAAAERYSSRLLKVLEYIDANPNEDLSIEKLSKVAAFSKYHFQRQFSCFFGIGVYRYVQLCRLKRASYQLAFRTNCSVIEVALDSGYTNPESFSRAFKKCIGQTPSEFRAQPLWSPWSVTYESLRELRSVLMKATHLYEKINIVDFPETRLAVVEHRGAPERIGDSIQKFIEWRKRYHTPPKVSATFNLVYDDPAEVAPEDYRFDIGAEFGNSDVPDNEFGVVPTTIPRTRCAVLRHAGSDDTLVDTVKYLYAEWLPQSGEELRDFPIIFQRVKFFPDVPENAAITDVFLPLR